MSTLFNKIINGKQFNFQSIEFGKKSGYHVDVKDDEGKRLEFSIFHADENNPSKMQIEGENLPSWITDMQAALIKQINDEE